MLEMSTPSKKRKRSSCYEPYDRFKKRMALTPMPYHAKMDVANAKMVAAYANGCRTHLKWKFTFFICINTLGATWPLILLKLIQLAHNLIALTCHRESPLITWILQQEFLRQHYRRSSYQVKQFNYSQCIMSRLIYILTVGKIIKKY